MNTEIEQFERIQEYLRNKMSIEERTAFERELATDDSLRQRYEELALLAHAVKKSSQAADLKLSLENMGKTSEPSRIIDAELDARLTDVERDLQKMGIKAEKPKNIINIHRINWAQSGKWVSYAAAACVAFAACTTAYFGYDARKVGYGYEFPTGIKGSSEIEALMERKENKAAISKIEESRKILKEELENPMYDDQLYMESLEVEAQELDFLEAVCQLRRGRYFSGKKALNKIYNNGGAYSEKAKELLDKL